MLQIGCIFQLGHLVDDHLGPRHQDSAADLCLVETAGHDRPGAQRSDQLGVIGPVRQADDGMARLNEKRN